jgi:hypothetical protein
VIVTLVPEPSSTPIAETYREIARAAERTTNHGSFGASAYDPASVAAARAHWRKRMVDEYESTTVFSSLAAQLVEANATLDATVVMLRMAQDEFRHAELCGHVVRALGGLPSASREHAVRPIAVHAGCSPEERAIRNVLVTSISESYSAAYFVASLDCMTDPYLRSVTRELLGDEVLHARFGFWYLQAWADWLSARPDVRASISMYLRHVFAVCERELVKPDTRVRAPDDERLGLVSGETSREMFQTTMAEAVAPALERFGLDAARAFSSRALAT